MEMMKYSSMRVIRPFLDNDRVSRWRYLKVRVGIADQTRDEKRPAQKTRDVYESNSY